MQTPFFPELAFGWAYVIILLGILTVASVLDLRTMRVPKWLTLTALPLGIVVNIVRGAWLASDGQAAWALEPNGWMLGALDGLLFALAGFAVGFVLFFLMWILGACGGGDVKLFAALGAWLGPALAIQVLLASLVVVICV